MLESVSNTGTADFYLYFNEGFHPEAARRCVRIHQVSFGAGSRISALLVGVDPPLSGELYGVDHSEIRCLLLSALFQGQSFSPVEKWPMQVHVYMPLIEGPELRTHINVAEVKNIALGEICYQVKK